MRNTQKKAGTPHFILTIYPPDGERGECSKHGGFCKGTYLLLRGVEETGSLHHAAKDLGMSYSKAWTLINGVEDDFQKSLLVRHGAKGSVLSDFGRKLMNEYEHMYQDAMRLRGHHIW